MKFENDTVAKIADTLQTLNNELGKDFPIPPKTAKMIADRRKSFRRFQRMCDDSRLQHFGWITHMPPIETLTDPLTMFMLWEELAEIHDLPMAFFSALGLQMRTDPGIMKVYNQGVWVFFTDKNGQPTLEEKHAKLTTPAFHRAAWDGALAGFWDMEDVMMLPSCIDMPVETLMEITEQTPQVGAEIYFVEPLE